MTNHNYNAVWLIMLIIKARDYKSCANVVDHLPRRPPVQLQGLQRQRGGGLVRPQKPPKSNADRPIPTPKALRMRTTTQICHLV